MFGLDDALAGVGLASAGVGLIGGLFGGGGSAPQLGAAKFSPDSFKSYSFNDISLARDNPELYSQLMQNSRMIDQANQILNSRRQGLSPEEQRTLASTKNNMTARLAAQGLIGDPVAEQAIADSEAKIRERASAQAYQDQLGALGQIASLRQQQYGNLSNAQNQIMNANEANRSASLQRDQAMQNREQAQYQGDTSNYNAQQQGRNQFYSGLLGGGLSMLGNYANQSRMSDMQNQNQQNWDKYINRGISSAPTYTNGAQSLGGQGMLASGYSAPGTWGF